MEFEREFRNIILKSFRYWNKFVVCGRKKKEKGEEGERRILSRRNREQFLGQATKKKGVLSNTPSVHIGVRRLAVFTRPLIVNGSCIADNESYSRVCVYVRVYVCMFVCRSAILSRQFETLFPAITPPLKRQRATLRKS